jgi:hypothetical protein
MYFLHCMPTFAYSRKWGSPSFKKTTLCCDLDMTQELISSLLNEELGKELISSVGMKHLYISTCMQKGLYI